MRISDRDARKRVCIWCMPGAPDRFVLGANESRYRVSGGQRILGVFLVFIGLLSGLVAVALLLEPDVSAGCVAILIFLGSSWLGLSAILDFVEVSPERLVVRRGLITRAVPASDIVSTQIETINGFGYSRVTVVVYRRKKPKMVLRALAEPRGADTGWRLDGVKSTIDRRLLHNQG